MLFAPVLIPTLCRYEKFVKCFESLNENTWADRTDVFISLDYPTKPSHRDGHDRIKDYCNGVIINGSFRFKSVTLICRTKNHGAIGNFEHLVHEILQKYDRCIRTFDDIEHSKNFIQYMDEMLEVFKDDKSVSMVCGYSYPVNWITCKNATVVKQNIEGNIWGVGFWKEEWNESIEYLRRGALIKQFSSAFRSGKFDGMTDWTVKDYTNAVVNGATINSLLKRVTDVSLRIYLSVADKYAIMPVVSKTRNIGFDGSGAFCEEITFNEDKEVSSSNYRFDLQPIDSADTFVSHVDYAFDNKMNCSIVDRFDKRPEGEREEMLARAEAYANLCRWEQACLNLKANIRKINNLIMRIKKTL